MPNSTTQVGAEMKSPADQVNAVLDGQSEGCILHGSAAELLELLPAKCCTIVTDTPYGVGVDYDQYQDTPETLQALADETWPAMDRVATRIMITPGVQHQRCWPKPRWTLCWALPNVRAAGSGPWGFTCWQPILAYGPDPFLARCMGRRPDTFTMATERAPKINHPCPKPLTFSLWLVERATAVSSELVVDCFCGSGQYLKAAKLLGRRYIGIDLSADYCDLARRQLANTEAPLFQAPPLPPEQGSLV